MAHRVWAIQFGLRRYQKEKHGRPLDGPHLRARTRFLFLVLKRHAFKIFATFAAASRAATGMPEPSSGAR
jgi:hypothetical protein